MTPRTWIPRLLLGPALVFALQVAAPAADTAPDDTQSQTDVAALRAHIQELEQRTAIQQHDLEILRRRLDQLTSASQTSPIAPVVRTASLTSSSPPTTGPERRPPAESSVDNVYQAHNALFSRGLTLTPSFAEAYSDSRFFTLNGFMAMGAIFLGNINVSQQKSNISIFSLNATYGLTDRLQLSATLPYLRRDTAYTTVGANDSSSQPSEVKRGYNNFGDANVGVFYQAMRETSKRPNVIVNAQVTIPTGRSPYGIKLVQDTKNTNLTYPSSMPTGQGVYGISTGVTLLKTLDPAVFFGGINYYYNVPSSFGDISTDPHSTVPGMASPGNSLGLNLGTAFAINDRTSLSFALQDTYTANSRIKAAGAAWQDVVGSSANAAVLNIGMSYAVNQKLSWATQLGIGLTHDAPNFQLNMRFPHRF